MKIPKFFIPAVVLALFLAGCSSDTSRKGEPMKTPCGHTSMPSGMSKEKDFFAMDTYNTVTIYDDVPESVLDVAEKRMEELESLWSVTDKDSEVYAVNHANGEPVTISEETAELIQFSLDMAEKTEGALDISLYPVLTAWGFTTGAPYGHTSMPSGNQAEKTQIPSEETLAEKMELTGLEKIFLSEDSLSMQPDMQIDLGAVAKGYACDLLAQQLKGDGVTSAILSLGGSVCAIGSKPDGNDYKISVQNPEYGDSLGLLSISDSCVVTSGAYERYFEGENGKRYGHILSPSTGRPAESGLVSVTVVGKEGKLCDALSTAFFVMGLSATEEYFRTYGGIDFLLITEDGEIYLSDGLKDKFTLSETYKNLPLYVME